MPPRTNSPRNTTSKRPADFTGQLQQKQQRELAEDKKRADELSMINAQQRQLEDEQEIDTSLDATYPKVEVHDLEVKSPKVHGVRVNYPIEDMTFGRIIIDPGDPESGVPPVIGPLRTLSYEEGKSYTMDREVYEHLDRKGYIWH